MLTHKKRVLDSDALLALARFWNDIILKFHCIRQFVPLNAYPLFGSKDAEEKFTFTLPTQIPGTDHWYLLVLQFPNSSLENGNVQYFDNDPIAGSAYDIQNNITMWYAKCFGSLWSSQSKKSGPESVK